MINLQFSGSNPRLPALHTLEASQARFKRMGAYQASPEPNENLTHLFELSVSELETCKTRRADSNESRVSALWDP